MTDPNNGSKRLQKRKYFAYGEPDSDADEEHEGTEVGSRSVKGRPSHYLEWAEPDTIPKSVPRKTLKGLCTPCKPSKEGGCSSHQNLPDDDERDQSCYFESTIEASSPKSQGNRSGTSRLLEVFEHENVASLPAFHGRLSDDASYNGSSDTEIDEYCLKLHEEFSEDDEEEEPPTPEAEFIPLDNLLERPEGSPIAVDVVLPPGHVQGVQTNPEEIVPEGVTTPGAVHQNVTVTIPSYQSTLTQLMVSKFTEIVPSNVCLTRREILLNMLRLTESHDVNNELFVGICKLINSIFCDPILPDTVYKLDRLLLSTCGLKYHFYCAHCLKPLYNSEQADSVTCKNCKFVNNVSDLSKATYFISFDICTQLEIILKDPVVACKLLDSRSYRRISPGMADLWDGELFQNFLKSLDFSDGATHLSFIICFDGSPLYKSSSYEIWPLLGTLNELPPLDRMQKLFLIGLWFGDKKPNFTTFFKPIVNRITSLSTGGATINVGGQQTFVKLHCIGCCVDSGARGPMQGIHLHNGAFGCSWCLHPGESEGHGSSARKYKYLEDRPTLRTHQQIFEDAQALKMLPSRAPSAPKPHINGVVYSSPLLEVPHFDIVKGMVVDVMHNSFLGVARQFLRLWAGLDGNVKLPDGTLPDYYIGAPSSLEKINQRIAVLVPPIEVRRLPRPISDLVHYKAHELENFLFYYLVPVMTGILKKRFLRHMTLYIQGMYLLMKDIVLPEDIVAAEFLLDLFVKEIELLYQNENFTEFKNYTYNVHLSLHAGENAKRWGSAWSVSGYAFENGIGILKKVVHANKGIPTQIARALCKSNITELLSQDIKSARCASFFNEITPQKSANVTFVNNVKVFGLFSQDFQPTDEEEKYLLQESSLKASDFSTAKKNFCNGALFAPRQRDIRTRNDFAVLNTGEIVQLKKIIVSETLQAVLIFSSYVHVERYPVQSLTNLSLTSPFLYNVELIENEKHLLSCQSLSKPCMYSNLKHLGGIETVSVMTNIFNKF